MTYEEFKVTATNEIDKIKAMVKTVQVLGATRVECNVRSDGRITLDISLPESKFCAVYFGEGDDSYGFAEYDTTGDQYRTVHHEYVFPDKDETEDDLPFA